MGLRISELNESQLAELEKNPRKGVDRTPFVDVETLKYIELSREEQLRMCFMKPIFATKDPKTLPQ